MKYVSGILAVLFLAVICFGAGAVLSPRYLPWLSNVLIEDEAPVAVGPITPDIPSGAQTSPVDIPPTETASTATSATLSVSGSGVVSTVPDYVVITLGVSEIAEEAIAAQNSVNAKIETIKQALLSEEIGVAARDISIGDLGLYAEYDYSEATEKLVGYNASHQLRIKVTQLDRTGIIIDAALNAGANRLYGVEYMIDDENAAYNEALAIAIRAAGEKARVAAEAAGETLGTLVRVSENYNTYSFTNDLRFAVADSAANAAIETPTDISAGTVSVSAQVGIEYLLSVKTAG